MKKILWLLVLACLALAVGCSTKTELNQETYVLTHPKTGEPLKDAAGNYLTGTRKYSDEDSFNRAQVANQKAAKPIAALIAPDDKPLQLSAGARFEVYGENGKPKLVKQYVPESTQNIRELRKGARDIMPGVLIWKGMDTMEAIANGGSKNTYNNSFNANQGVQSGSGRVTGGVSSVSVSGEGNTGTGAANPTDTSTSTSSSGGNSLGSIGSN